MNSQKQWIDLYTKVFKLHQDMIQDGSAFLDNKHRLPLGVRVKCFFRAFYAKKYSKLVNKLFKIIASDLQYVEKRLDEIQAIRESFAEDESAKFEYLAVEQNDHYKQVRNQQLTMRQDSLERAYQELQTNIVDLCAVLDTLNIIKDAFCIKIDDKVTNEIHKIVDQEISKLKKYADTNIQKIVVDICGAKTFDSAWKLYERYQNLLKDFTIVKYNDGKDPAWKVIDLYKPFSHIEESKRHIYSIYYTGQVNCISRNALMRNKNSINSERNIEFDSNVARYLKSFAAGQKLDVDISGIIKLIRTTQGLHFDYLPYMLENRLSDNYDAEGMMKNIFYIERLYYGLSRNKITDKNCLDAAKKQLSVIDNDYILNLFSGWYKKVYVRMLIIAYMYLNFSKSPSKQFQNLCYAFSEELNDFAIPELSMAYDFYYHHNIAFLSCIQKNTKNLTLKIKNMSWDIFHIRNLYENSIAIYGGDLCIQYFCTFDDALVGIFKYYELDALAVCKRTSETIPYFHINNVPLKMIKRYFNNITSKKTINIDSVIAKYENLIEKIIG